MNNFIVVDVETGGLNPELNPLLSIGAVNFNTGKSFYGECAPMDLQNKVATKQALMVNGIDIDEWRNKPNLFETINKFSKWLGPNKNTLAGHNPNFDLSFIQQAFYESETWFPFRFRTIDMHSLAYAKFGESLNSDEIYVKLGMVKEPRPHNAMVGAMHEARALKILMEVI